MKAKKNKGFDLSSLHENVGTGLCTASINSKAILDENDNGGYYVSLYNASEEQVLKIVKEHPNGRIIDDRVCIGKQITIYKEWCFMETIEIIAVALGFIANNAIVLYLWERSKNGKKS